MGSYDTQPARARHIGKSIKMGTAYFYHLTRQPFEKALPQLIEKAVSAGLKVEVRMSDASRLSWLDEKLWLGPEDSFLPHGIAGGEYDYLQPVLLSTQSIDQSQCLMLVEGAEVSVEELNQKVRVCVLFEGNNNKELSKARNQWQEFNNAGCGLYYWSEESGHWQKKAEANIPAT